MNSIDRKCGLLERGWNSLPRRWTYRCQSSWAWVLFLVCATQFGGDPVLFAQSDTIGPRHIVVIDQSFSMARRRKVLAESVSEMIRTGLSGHIVEGEVIEIWTFDQSVDRSKLPEIRWTQRDASARAREVFEWIDRLKFAGQTRTEGLMRAFGEAVNRSAEVTIVLFSDGDVEFSGTPFDLSINLAYGEHGRELRKRREPFVTVLRAREGAFGAWAVFRGGDSIHAPAMPPVRKSEMSEPQARVPVPVDRVETRPSTVPPVEPPIDTIVPVPDDPADSAQSSGSQSGIVRLNPEATLTKPIEPASESSTNAPVNRTEPAKVSVTQEPNPSAMVVEKVGQVHSPKVPPIQNVQEPVNDTSHRHDADPTGTPGETVAITVPVVPSAVKPTVSTAGLPAEIPEAVHVPEPSKAPLKQRPPGSTKTPDKPGDRPILTRVKPTEPGDQRSWYLTGGLTLCAAAFGLGFWLIRGGGRVRRSSIISRSMNRRED